MVTARRLILLSALVYSQFFWTRTLGVLPPAANWVDDVLALLLGVFALTRVPQPTRLPRTWGWLLVAFLVVATVSAFANDVALRRAALGLRGLLVYLGLYYAVVVSSLGRHDIRRVFGALVVLMILQVPIQLIQFVFGAARYGLSFEVLGDVAPGTLGPGLSNNLGLLFLPFIVGALAMVFSRSSWLWALLAIGLTLGLILCSARAALLMLPACLVLVAVLARGWRVIVAPRALLVAGVVFAVAGGFAGLYYRLTTGGGGFLARLSPVQLVREQVAYSPVSAARLAYYPVTWAVLTTVAPSPWIGLGPGNYGSGAGYLTNAPGLALIRDVFGQFETNRETALNSQFLATLGETGILGVSLFMLMIISVARRTLRVRQVETDEVQRAILAAVFIGQLVFLLGGFVEYAWETQPLSFTFWLGSALVTKLGQHQVQTAPAPVAGMSPVV